MYFFFYIQILVDNISRLMGQKYVLNLYAKLNYTFAPLTYF